jgi:CRISPR/Cas system-associated endonuclease/helicase Cas3
VLFRAVAPLDPIIQPAGRCNRERKLVEGTLIAFDPADDATPLGLYREFTRRTRGLLGLESTSIAADSHPAGTPEASGDERLRPRENGQRSSGGERGGKL